MPSASAGIQIELKRLDLLFQRRLTPHERLHIPRLDGLLEGHGGKLGQAAGELAGERADFPIEVAIVGVDHP